MSVTEAQRHELYESIKAVHGETVAETFMNLHTVDVDELATRADLAATRADIRADLAQLELRLERSFRNSLWASQGAVAGIVSLVVTLATVFG
jgi:hypothetical protein